MDSADRQTYLKRAIETAHRNAKGADTVGNYSLAEMWETRARNLWRELLQEQKKGESDEQKNCRD